MNKSEFLKYKNLPTERINKNTFNIDRLDLIEIVKKLNEEDKKVPVSISKSLREIASGAKLISDVFLNGGKVIFIGAGTSGRLGIIEAVEMVPTYGVKPSQFKAIIAGGRSAVFKAKEGAEDDYEGGRKAVMKEIKEGDLLIAIAASGITPYVRGAIYQTKKQKGRIIFVTANPSVNDLEVDVMIAVDVGPEPINGSTRMKSGTATKLILNMLTTTAMVLSGKVYHNWMVDLKPTNNKLVMRAKRVFCEITGESLETASRYLEEADYNLKLAIVMAVKKLDKKSAKNLIKRHRGFLKDILEK